MEPVKISDAVVAPVGWPVKLNRPPAFGLSVVCPTAVKELKVRPVAVGAGVGSVVPEEFVTFAKL